MATESLVKKLESAQQMITKLKKSSGGDSKEKNELIKTKVREMESLFLLLPNSYGDLVIKWANIINELKSEDKKHRSLSPFAGRLIFRRSSPHRQHHRSRSRSRSPFFRTERETKCYWCHASGHWAKDCKRLAREQCYICHNFGHISKHCYKRP